MDMPDLENDPATTTNTSVTDSVRLAFEAGRLAEAKSFGACLI